MISRTQSAVKKIVEQGYNVVPLFPNGKDTHDHNWINKKYSIDDFLDDSNIGYVSNILRSISKERSIFLISHRHIDQIEADEVMSFS